MDEQYRHSARNEWYAAEWQRWPEEKQGQRVVLTQVHKTEVDQSVLPQIRAARESTKVRRGAGVLTRPQRCQGQLEAGGGCGCGQRMREHAEGENEGRTVGRFNQDQRQAVPWFFVWMGKVY